MPSIDGFDVNEYAYLDEVEPASCPEGRLYEYDADKKIVMKPYLGTDGTPINLIAVQVGCIMYSGRACLDFLYLYIQISCCIYFYIHI